MTKSLRRKLTGKQTEAYETAISDPEQRCPGWMAPETIVQDFISHGIDGKQNESLHAPGYVQPGRPSGTI